MRLAPVFVIWQDAVSVDAWEDLAEARSLELHTIKTLGFLIAEEPDRLIVAHNLDEEGGACSQHIAIPRTWIRELRHLPEALCAY